MSVNKIAPDIKRDLNLLADMMLMLDGYKSCLDAEQEGDLYDYSASGLPRCQKSWNKAVTAYSFLKKKPDFLRFQVKVASKDLFYSEQEGN